ncbi:MAG: hypothetical protein H0X30_37695 [Anaerolineae bacterium]|nr:hypothetical protein [Anaerolineae bacterium]
MTKPLPPARLFVLLAREAPVGVILRHGPTDWVQMIKWHTDTDKFEEGQWLHAKVFDRRCDLSPDGQFVICFVARINRRTLADKEFTYSWTTLSRPPYFTALALWPKGDSYNGGGLFETSNIIWLNHHNNVPHPNFQPQNFTIIPRKFGHGEDEPIYDKNLEWNGWTLQREGEYKANESSVNAPTDPQKTTLWDKKSSKAGMRLSMEYLGYFVNTRPGTPSRFGYHIHDIPNYHIIHLPLEVSWADFDQQGRLVLAKEGKLFSGTLENDELQLTELADFNPNKPKPQPAPDWAQKW